MEEYGEVSLDKNWYARMHDMYWIYFFLSTGKRQRKLHRVLVLGHSQLPKSIRSMRGVHIQLERRGGASIDDLWNVRQYMYALRKQYDHVVLFLGGNDVTSVDVDTLYTKLESAVEHVRQKTGCTYLTVVLIEPRNWHGKDRHQVCSDIYTSRMFTLNRRLDRLGKRQGFKTLRLSSQPFQHGHVRDGVHFNFDTQRHLNAKIVKCICHVYCEARRKEAA